MTTLPTGYGYGKSSARLALIIRKLMSTTPTDIQLKQTLVKMLPEVVIHTANKQHEFGQLNWMGRPELVLDTELLHLCWLVEESLSEYQEFNYSCDIKYHATWQQRVIALAKVKGIEICQ